MSFLTHLFPLRRLTAKLSRLLLAPALLALIPLIISLFLPLSHTSAVSKSWDGGCGLGDTTWSCANNWSDNIVPASGDTVTFNATSTNNSVVDAGFAGTITTININSGYTGTISLSRSLTVSTTFSQAAGTFNAGSQTLTLAAFTLSAGSFTASSGTTNISGAMTISGSPTFNANGGTVNINGSTTATLSCNNVTFNLVTFTHTGSTKTVSSNCSLPLGANPSITGLNATVSLSGTLSGSGTLNMVGGGGQLVLNSGGSLSGFTGFTGASLQVSGTYNFGSYTTFSLTSTFTVNSGGVFTAPSGTASFASTFTLSSGSTFNANGGTINFNGTTTATLSCNSATFNLVTFTHTAGTKTVSSNCSLPLGNNPNANSGGSITNNGTLSGTGTFTTSGTFTFGVGSTVSGFTGRVASGLIINGTANYGSYTTFTVSAAFTLNSGGVFTAPSGTASFASTFTINSGSTFDANGGTINFNGTASATLSCGSKTFNLVTFTHTSGTRTVSSDCSLPLGNNPSTTGPIVLNGTLSGSGTLSAGGTLTLGATGALSGFSGLSASGSLIVNGTYNFGSYSTFTVTGTFLLNSGATFTAPSGTASFTGSFTLSSGSTFNANGGTVDFTGGANATLSCNNTVFNHVTFTNTNGTKTVSSDCSLPLGSNPTVGAGGAVSLNGTLSGSGLLTKSVGTLTLGVGGVLSGFSGLSAITLVVNGAYDFGTYSPFTVASTFTVNSGGVFTAPTGTASFGGNFTLNSGSTFNANGGTVNFNGSGGTTLSCNNAVFHLATFNNTNTTIVSSNCSFPLGNNPTIEQPNGFIRLSGTFSGTGTLTTVDSLLLNAGSTLVGFSGLSIGNALTIDAASYDFSSYTTFIVTNDYAIQNSAAVTASSGTTTINRDVGISGSAIFNAGSGTINISRNFVNYATATFNAGSGTLNVKGGFTNAGTFNAGTGTVVLSGAAQTITGSTTFYNLTKTVSSADTLTFAAGDTVTVGGLLTLQGANGALLSLVSSAPGTTWLIDAEGITNVDYVDVADSSSIGQTIVACNSVDSGGNSGWSFNPNSCYAPAPPKDGGTSATVSSTSAITNFQLLQAFLAAQSAQNALNLSHNSAFAFGIFDDGSLPSKIQNFLHQFPAGSGLVTAAGQFTKFMLGLLVLLVLAAAFIWWWYHRSDKEDMPDEYPPILAPPSTNATPTGTPAAGTTVHPTTLPQKPKPFDIHTAPTQPATKPTKESWPWTNK